MSTPATTQPRTQELHRSLSLEMYDRARERGLTFSQWLEREDPSAQHRDGTDAFQRQLREARILTNSHPRGHYAASEMKEFGRDDQTRALFPEFVNRTIERVRFRMHAAQERLQAQLVANARAIYLSSETAEGSTLRPFADDPILRMDDETAPAVPLDEVVAGTRFVSGDTARSTYLVRDATQARMKRVVEATEIPGAKLTTSQNAIRFGKYGLKLETSYEAIRRLTIDQFAEFLQELAVQAEVDKVAAAVDILVNGDGNSNTAATTHNLSDLDPNADAGELTMAAWVAYRMKFANPYMLTTAVAREDVMAQLVLLNMGSANLPLTTRPDLGGLTPINSTLADGVRWGVVSDAPASKIVGFDRRRAIQRVVESGSLIQEMDRYITKQTEVLVVSENEGFETKQGPRAVRILNLAA